MISKSVPTILDPYQLCAALSLIFEFFEYLVLVLVWFEVLFLKPEYDKLFYTFFIRLNFDIETFLFRK